MLISFSLSSPDVMKIDARALYDYTARSDKELTFSRGDMLYVVSKTPDHNWWDGFHQGKRGYIPVAYVEIIQLDSVAVPEPPERKSSIPLEQVLEDKVQTPKASEPPAEATIFEVEEAETRVKPTPEQEDRLAQEEKKEEEEEEGKRLKEDGERKTKDDEKTKVEDDKAIRMEDGKKAEEGEEKKEVKPPVKVEIKPPETTTETRTPKRQAPVRGSVKTLTQQFQEPPPTQQRVLVEPHSTHHRRQNSDTTGWKAEQPEPLSTRSASGGSKVSMLSSTFEMKAAEGRSGPPPPLKPKPQMHSSPVPPDPTSPSAAFPIVSHGTIPSASPLQRAAMVGQMSQSSPSAAVKKPPAAPNKPRGSLKVKRERSTKRDEKPPKPVKPPLPAQGFIPPPHSATPQARSQALHEEIQAAAAARRKATENLK